MLLDDLCTLLARHARPDTTTAIENLLIGREDTDSPSPPVTGMLMALVAQGAKRLAYGEHVYDCGAGQYVIASIVMTLKGRFIEATPERPLLGLCLLLQPSDVAEVMLQAPPGTVADNDDAAPVFAFGTASDDLLDAVVRLVRLLDQPRDREMLATLYKREILWRLITSEHGATVRQIGLADSRLSPVTKAVQWIRDHYKEPFKVEDLARLTGMGTSAFYHNFRAVTQTTPIQFQKKIRLQEARLLLAANPKDVANIGYLVGYDSPSQFSREYRRLFGAPPSQDAIQFSSPSAGEKR